jgi:hypothetical protein
MTLLNLLITAAPFLLGLTAALLVAAVLIQPSSGIQA